MVEVVDGDDTEDRSCDSDGSVGCNIMEEATVMVAVVMRMIVKVTVRMEIMKSQ